MNEKQLMKIIYDGESATVEFKSWIKTKKNKERINLAVQELIAFANANGGTVFFGVEDDGEITGCKNYDVQNMIEAIYDKTRPSLFVEAEEIECKEGVVLAFSVEHDSNIYGTTDGRFLKRLGKNTKPFYPGEMSNKYYSDDLPDFSAKIVMDSSFDDVNLLEVYALKEKLKLRDPKSTLPELDDKAFLRDLGLIKFEDGVDRLTVAGLIFVGKQNSITHLLPQAEVIYLHYSNENLEEYDARLDMRQPIVSILDRLTEKIQDNNKIINVQVGLFRMEVEDFSERVFQEALLNAMSHRDYESPGAIYVKHYPDKIVIENPGGFIDGITADNIITHPSAPRNKLIAETLQHLKYVQRTGQGVDIIYREMVSMGKPYPEYHVFSYAVSLTLRSAIEDMAFVRFIIEEQDKEQLSLPLPQLMILRYLSQNRRITLAETQKLIQMSIDETKKHIHELIQHNIIEHSGRSYMLTVRVYNTIKSNVEYSQDKVLQYVKAKSRILDYIELNGDITNSKAQELCGYTKDQVRNTFDKMKAEKLILLVGSGRGAKYILTEKTR
jgi:ATP-dependent DNA helicase RecG